MLAGIFYKIHVANYQRCNFKIAFILRSNWLFSNDQNLRNNARKKNQNLTLFLSHVRIAHLCCTGGEVCRLT